MKNRSIRRAHLCALPKRRLSLPKEVMKIILLDNYDSFTYNLLHYISELGADVTVFRNDKITVAEIAAMKPDGIVISPGPGTPQQSGICLDLLKQLSGKIPIFGVCLGMQAMGDAFGGKV